MFFSSASAATQSSYQSERLSFTVKFKDEVNPYRILGVFVMPAEEFEVECVFTNPQSTFTVSVPAGKLPQLSKEAVDSLTKACIP